jgi:hypothetical protein
MIQNDFTKSLLNYSAERDDCIGRPERWGSPPSLVVNTPLHDEMAALADDLWAGSSRLVWYFLIGGPGNGKSEAVGAFVRRLNDNAQKVGEPQVFDATTGQYGGSIPYWFHESIPHGEVTLLQDVSVPKNSGSDPAEDLLASLDLCASPGAHLLACANRGMLLRATRLARTEPTYRWLLEVLERVDEQSQETATAVGSKWQMERDGKQIEIRVWPLDHESVLFGEGNGNLWAEPAGSLFDQIIATAVAEENWETTGCVECPARELCPLLGDARWLRDPDRRRSFLRILRNAEVWSGQRIVLREALGLVSMVLVGCPSDFIEGGVELHPCEWVQKRLLGTPAKPKDEQALMELISHRVYQDLFARPAPTGLALDRAHEQRDQWISERLKLLGSLGEAVALALRSVDHGFAKQAGPPRLVGANGILQPFDPAKDNAWCSKYSLATDGQISDLRQVLANHQGELEQELGDLFKKLEDAAGALPPHKDPARAFSALYRWASTFYLRIAGVALGEIPNGDSIADYLTLLQHPQRPIQAAGNQTTLRDLMKSAAAGGQSVDLAPSFVADLSLPQPKPIGARSRSNNPRWPANDRLALQVGGQGSTRLEVPLTANTFIDAWRKQVLQIADWNISPAMENLMRAWRDDYIVAKGQFRNLQSVEFKGKQALEFEFISTTEIQVRPK